MGVTEAVAVTVGAGCGGHCYPMGGGNLVLSSIVIFCFCFVLYSFELVGFMV